MPERISTPKIISCKQYNKNVNRYSGFFLISCIVLFYVMISKGQSRAGWPLRKERTGKEEVATGENRSWHGRSCIFQNPSLGLLQRIFRKLLHYEKQLKGIRNNNFSLNKPVKREICP